MSKATTDSHWAQIAASLPTDLAGSKVLDLRPIVDSVSEGIDSRGAMNVIAWDGSDELAPGARGFDLVVCRDALNRSAYPANLLSRIWAGTAEGGKLVIQCRVMTAVDLSIYARFVDARIGEGETEWLPGRLAFRWSVETSGFDIDGWIDSPALEGGPGEGDAYLTATRVARTPALDFSIPESADR